MHFRSLTLDDLTIDDERSFRHIALYEELKQVLRRSGYRFHVPPAGSPSARWDRALFLNLTFWHAAESGDVLVEDHIAADVVAHVAWHHLTQRALAGGSTEKAPHPRITAGGLFLGESIASAFDLYLVGRLLGHSPDSDFLQTQVPAMAEVAEAAGMSEDEFEALLGEVASDPDRAFEDLRELLFDAASTLVRCRGVTEASEALLAFEGRRFAPLLHHYELSNWILYARAYAPDALPAAEGADRAADPATDPIVQEVDTALRSAPVALDWLEERWVKAIGQAGAA